MKLIPMNDRVVIERDPRQTATESGIVLPSAGDKPEIGTVVAVGPGKHHDVSDARIPMFVARGDKVLFGKFSGQTIKAADKEFLVMREDEILAIVRD